MKNILIFSSIKMLFFGLSFILYVLNSKKWSIKNGSVSVPFPEIEEFFRVRFVKLFLSWI